MMYLWRAVDQDGQTLDILVQLKRNQQAAERFFRKLRKQNESPRNIVTDKLKSYIKSCQSMFPKALCRERGHCVLLILQ